MFRGQLAKPSLTQVFFVLARHQAIVVVSLVNIKNKLNMFGFVGLVATPKLLQVGFLNALISISTD